MRYVPPFWATERWPIQRAPTVKRAHDCHAGRRWHDVMNGSQRAGWPQDRGVAGRRTQPHEGLGESEELADDDSLSSERSLASSGSVLSSGKHLKHRDAPNRSLPGATPSCSMI